MQKNSNSEYIFLALLNLRFDYILLLSVSLIWRVYKNRTNLKSLSMSRSGLMYGLRLFEIIRAKSQAMLISLNKM